MNTILVKIKTFASENIEIVIFAIAIAIGLAAAIVVDGCSSNKESALSKSIHEMRIEK